LKTIHPDAEFVEDAKRELFERGRVLEAAVPPVGGQSLVSFCSSPALAKRGSFLI